MDSRSKSPIPLPWSVPLIQFLSDKHFMKLPLFGPLNITDYRQFLDDGKQIFNECLYLRFPHHISLDELTFVHCIAKGGFGKIILVERKNKEKTLYAMKVISKSFMIANNCLGNILNEKRMLQSLQFPFCLRLDYISISKSHIFLVMPFISGGDIFTHLSKSVKFEENRARFYAAQMVLAIEFLQNCDVVHRDLKPENILLDHFGFLKIADFGLAKVVATRTYTFCGTVQYTAPEVILGKGYGKAVDWWSLGIFIFEMTSGHVPFSADDEVDTLEKILMTEVEFPKHFSTELKSLVRGLLQKNVSRRVGNLKLGVDEIKSHPWFNGINWLELLNRNVIPPFIPDHSSRFGETNFPHVGKISDISVTRPSIFDHFFHDF